MMDRDDLARLAKSMGRMMREYVSAAIHKIASRLDEQDLKIAAIPAGPQGPPGERGHDGLIGMRGEPGEPGAAGKDGRDGRDGKDGQHGRDGQDALAITVLESVDEARSYPRGTWACHKGGVARFDGQQWKCIVRGIDYETDTLSEDFRTRIRKTVYSDGSIQEAVSQSSVLIYREIFKEGTEYTHGDVVTWNNSAWHCRAAHTTAKPGDGPDWVLMVREGRRGKDGAPGPEGRPGKDGRDAVDGRKH